MRMYFSKEFKLEWSEKKNGSGFYHGNRELPFFNEMLANSTGLPPKETPFAVNLMDGFNFGTEVEIEIIVRIREEANND